MLGRVAEDTRLRRRRFAKILAGSLLVYAVPLVGPHASWLVIEALIADVTRASGHKPLGWIALDFAAALVAQAALALLLAWVLTRRGAGRFALLAASAPVFFLALEWTYLWLLPSYFLIEPDSALEVSDWPTECFVPDVALASVRTPPDLPLERAARAWVTQSGGRSYALLDSCSVAPAIDPGEALLTAPFVLADGKAVFGIWDRDIGHQTWWIAPGGGAAAARLPHPPADPDRSAPILSDDGAWVAWKRYDPMATTPPLAEQIVLRSIDGAREHVVPLAPPGRAEVELLGADVSMERLTLFEHEYATGENSLVALDLTGAAHGAPVRIAGVAAQSTTLLRVGEGWVAWDAYREEGRYRLRWRTPRGAGAHEVPLGRSITAVDTDPSGSYVAVSTTTALNIGRIRDSVFVLRTSDGVEVFRRYLPTYARSRVAFLGSFRFALDDREGERFGVRVLQIPTGGTHTTRESPP
jgi:hypothetical protein